MPKIAHSVEVDSFGGVAECLTLWTPIPDRELSTMKIKWKDHHGGMVKNERWVRISKAKGLAMLKLARPTDFDWLKMSLDLGEEVETKNFTLKQE